MEVFFEVFQMYNEMKISDEKEKTQPSNKEIIFKNKVKSKNKSKFKNHIINFELLNPIN